MRRKHIVGVAALAAMVAAFAVLGAPAAANPPGITDVGKKIANFNIIATPHDWVESDSLCTNNGAGSSSASTTRRGRSCGSSSPASARRSTSPTATARPTEPRSSRKTRASPSTSSFRVLGPVTSSLDFICQVILDVNGVNECLIDSATFSHSKSFTKVTSHLFDDELSEVLWTLDPSTNFKIAQVDVYEQAS